VLHFELDLAFSPLKEAVLYTTGLGDIKVGTVIDAGQSVTKAVLPYVRSIVNSTGIGSMTLSQVAESTGIIPSEKIVTEKNPFKESLEPLTRSKYEQSVHEQKNNEILQQRVQAILAIDQYYTPEMQREVLAIMPKNEKYFIHPDIRITTNMPSVEVIIETAVEKPTQQTFDALQNALKATKMAIHVAQENRNIALISQLEQYKNQIIIVLKSPMFTQFQSWSSYAESFIPSTKKVLSTTGLGNITVDQALSGVSSVAPYVQSALDATGVLNMTIDQALIQAGVI